MKKLILFITFITLSYSCSSNDSSSSNNNPPISATPITDIDGNSYNTVVIGTQVWTQKNLDVKHYRNGDVIPQVTDYAQWVSLTTGAWCYYNNDPSNASYGILYNAFAVHDPRGLAPQGSHIASANEFQTLFNYCQTLNDASGIAGALRESGYEHWEDPNFSSNSTGFTALGTGYRDGSFEWQNQICSFWTSTPVPGSQLNTNMAEIQHNGTYSSGANMGWTNRIGCPVRCIKD